MKNMCLSENWHLKNTHHVHHQPLTFPTAEPGKPLTIHDLLFISQMYIYI